MSESANRRQKVLVQVLRKIPLFQGLSPSQVRRILGLCHHRVYQTGDTVCKIDTPSDEMYILLSGEVAIVTPDGTHVATIDPVTTLGEMGVITGEKRSATVEVTKPSAIFIIQKGSFEVALKEDSDMQVKCFKAIISVLSGKLNNDNVQLRDYKVEQGRYEGRIAVLERKLGEQVERVRLTAELVAEKTGTDIDEINLIIDDKVKDLMPRVLVVDDQPDFRTSVQEALPDFSVVEAENANAALDILREEKIDLVVTAIDIAKSEMDGYGLLENIKSQFPDLRVIAAYTWTNQDEVKDHDFDGFVEKPLNLEEFQQLVDQNMVVDQKQDD